MKKVKNNFNLYLSIDMVSTINWQIWLEIRVSIICMAASMPYYESHRIGILEIFFNAL